MGAISASAASSPSARNPVAYQGMKTTPAAISGRILVRPSAAPCARLPLPRARRIFALGEGKVGMTDHRMDGCARRLAKWGDLLYRTKTGFTSPPLSVFEGVARVLAAPVTRRTAVGLIGGGVVPGPPLRPPRARGAAGGCTSEATASNPQCCPTPGDRPCCVAANLHCCSNEN